MAQVVAEKRRPVAFVSFLAGDAPGFVLGVRVLGHSLDRHSTADADRLCILAAPISPASQRALRAAGWALQLVASIENPGTGSAEAFGSARFPRKLRHVYSKLAVFGLTQYERVVYLDADTLVVSASIDRLFSCPATMLCAALRHSEAFNSGVMVLSPKQTLHADMVAKVGTLPSSTGGDQGFLQSYIPSFASAPLWVPGSRLDAAAPISQLARMPTAYNADVGLFVLNANRWPLPAEQLAVLHFTLGPIKPWQWMAPWLISAADTWQEARREAQPGVLGRSTTPSRQLAEAAMLVALAPAVAYVICRRAGRVLLLSHRIVIGRPSPRGRSALLAGRAASWLASQTADVVSLPMVSSPAHALRLSTVAAVEASAAFAVATAAAIVPLYAQPTLGWCIFTVWASALFTAAFGCWLVFAWHWGRAHAHAYASAPSPAASTVIPGSPHLRAPLPRLLPGASVAAVWRSTTRAAVCAVCALAAVPWVPRLLGVRCMVPTVAAAGVAAACWAVLAAALAPDVAHSWWCAGFGAPADDTTHTELAMPLEEHGGEKVK
jgi:hypothetical protein